MIERRREPRIPTTLAGTLTIGGRTYLGTILDLSPLGAYFEFIDRDPFPHEGRGSLGSPALEAPVEVEVRSKRLREGQVAGLGMEFIAPSPAVRALVDRLRGAPPA